jgi:protoporphyrinogen/coproporphyrinogen III oxidase
VLEASATGRRPDRHRGAGRHAARRRGGRDAGAPARGRAAGPRARASGTTTSSRPLTGSGPPVDPGALRPLPTGTVHGRADRPAASSRGRAPDPAGVARAAAGAGLPATPGRRGPASPTSWGSGSGGGHRGSGRAAARRGLRRPDRPDVAAAAPPAGLGGGPASPALTAACAPTAGRAPPRPGPVFRTVRGGLSRLTGRLTEQLGDRVRTSSGVPLDPPRRRRLGGRPPGGAGVADEVVLAVPARVAAALLAGSSPRSRPSSRRCGPRPSRPSRWPTSVGAAPSCRTGSGILVPPREGRLVKAVTFASRKWPHHADRRCLLRASVGRVPADGWDRDPNLDLDDATLAERVDAEVRWATGLPRPPSPAPSVRWPDALPQYEVGHLQRVERIGTRLHTQAPGLHLAGASLRRARARRAGTRGRAARPPPRRAAPYHGRRADRRGGSLAGFGGGARAGRARRCGRC